MTKSFAIFSTLIFVFSLNAQDWCNHKPAKLDKPPLSFDNKLISDRFLHTISPSVINLKYYQIELVSIFSPELYQNGDWTRNDSMMHIYSIYNSYMIKLTLRKNLELQFSYNDLILKAENELVEYGNESLNTGFSIGAKYFIYRKRNNKAQFGFWGQITVPKPQNILSTFFSPELRVICSHPFSKHLIVTYNLGGTFIDNTQKPILIYDLNILRPIGDRFQLFTEFYSNYTKTGPSRNPSKRYLFGLGFYFYENLYCYSTIESGWAHEDTINDFRIDIGLTFRIKRSNNVFRQLHKV